MRNSFSSFCKESKTKESKNIKKENLQEAYDDLKDLSNDELTQKLYSEVKKQKENGDFNYNALCENVERLKMFLPQETYENMKNLLEKIK